MKMIAYYAALACVVAVIAGCAQPVMVTSIDAKPEDVTFLKLNEFCKDVQFFSEHGTRVALFTSEEDVFRGVFQDYSFQEIVVPISYPARFNQLPTYSPGAVSEFRVAKSGLKFETTYRNGGFELIVFDRLQRRAAYIWRAN